MRVIGLALVGVLAVIEPIAAQAHGPGPNPGPANAAAASGIVPARDDGGPAGRSAVGGRPKAGHVRQWNGAWGPRYWGPSFYPPGPGPYGWQGVPPYWVWGPSGGAFDYPFADWRGPTGGWGNP